MVEHKIPIRLSVVTDFISQASKQDQIAVIPQLVKQLHLSEREMLTLVKQEEVIIPIGIFNERVSCLEAIVKYLREEKLWSINEISNQLGRSNKTIWATYYNAIKKYKQKYKLSVSDYFIPLSLLKERKLSILETIILHLREICDLSYTDIAEFLKRDYKTIWGTYQKAKKRQLSVFRKPVVIS